MSMTPWPHGSDILMTFLNHLNSEQIYNENQKQKFCPISWRPFTCLHRSVLPTSPSWQHSVLNSLVHRAVSISDPDKNFRCVLKCLLFGFAQVVVFFSYFVRLWTEYSFLYIQSSGIPRSGTSLVKVTQMHIPPTLSSMVCNLQRWLIDGTPGNHITCSFPYIKYLVKLTLINDSYWFIFMY